MRLTVFLVCVLILLSVPSALPGQEQPSWYGTWRLNLDKSTTPSDSPRYKRVTTRIEPWNDGLKVTYDMVGSRGGVTHLEWTGKFDGIDYPVQGADTFLTNAYRKLDEHNYEVVVKVDTKVAATARVTVSQDGKTLTVVTTEKDARGKSVSTTTIYDRR